MQGNKEEEPPEAGLQLPLLMDISGTVWLDQPQGKNSEANGILDSGEELDGITVKLFEEDGATMNPLFLPPPTRAARSCSLNMTRNRNTIPTRTKSPTKKSCSRPMCRRSLQTAILYGTQPKRRKNNGTPSLPGDSCLPSQGKSRRDSTPTLSVTTAGSFLFPKA